MRGRMRGRGRGHLGGGEREGGRKWAVSLDPLLKSLSLPLLLFFIFFGITGEMSNSKPKSLVY